MVYMNLLKQTHGYQETFKHFNVCIMLCIRFRSINNELYRLKHANLIIHYWTRSNLCSKYQQIIHLEFLLYRYICGDALVLFEICKEHNYCFCVWHNFPKIHFKISKTIFMFRSRDILNTGIGHKGTLNFYGNYFLFSFSLVFLSFHW